MLLSSSSSDWGVLADPVLIAGNIASALIYLSGFTFLRLKNAFRLRPYIAMETASCLPMLAALLIDSFGSRDGVIFVILAWPILPIALAMPYVLWPSTDKGTSDHELRWDLKNKPK